MTDYFGYNVRLCMNITDIDDKIIIRAKEREIDFTKISRDMENEFFKDCEALNIRLPTVVTRVSEYVPEIVAFIQQIIDNGFAYESNGSVYFNVIKYSQSGDHTYAKLSPTSFGNLELLKEGEGALTEEQSEKINEQDFALWKKVKEGEPFWPSPWGNGRPGWHIECSAMAGAIFKEYPIDIHVGGVDLKFPHHDNEIAQSEAYYGCDNWVNNFWHTGHLHIKGKKMSKSLKNFTTIKEILQHKTAKQMRMLFLLHQWHTTMNYSPEDSFPEAEKKQKEFDEFFHNIKAVLRQCNIKETSQKWVAGDEQLEALLQQKQVAVREALCDNFDTPKAILHLSELVSATNIYCKQNPTEIKVPLLRQVSKFVFHILKCFGLYEDGDFPTVSAGAEDVIGPLMNALMKFRDDVKKNSDTGGKELFRLSDELRDDILPYLGIRLEDKGTQPSIWKYEDAATLIKERETKIADKAAKEEEKRLRKELDLKKKSTSGKDWFRTFETETYSKFDEETGLPTHMKKDDKPISDAIKNKLKKQQNSQQTKYEKWLKEEEAKASVEGNKEEGKE